MGQIVPVKSDSPCLCSGGGGGSYLQREAGRGAAACFCILWTRGESKVAAASALSPPCILSVHEKGRGLKLHLCSRTSDPLRRCSHYRSAQSSAHAHGSAPAAVARVSHPYQPAFASAPLAPGEHQQSCELERHEWRSQLVTDAVGLIRSARGRALEYLRSIFHIPARCCCWMLIGGYMNWAPGDNEAI